jgi:hypothetical protein
LLDYAALSVPSEIRSDGLPFGVTLIGPAGSDWVLLELGQRYHHQGTAPQGATNQPLPASITIPEITRKSAEPTVRVAVVGAHLSGMPLNTQLIENLTCIGCYVRDRSAMVTSRRGISGPRPRQHAKTARASNADHIGGDSATTVSAVVVHQDGGVRI